MKKIPAADAVGQALCHDLTAILPGGYKGAKFKKGHIIREEDVPELLNIGKSHVYVWEVEDDDVHEEEAAEIVTKAVCGANVAYSGPSEGKFTITSTIKGLFRVNEVALNKINRVKDYTIACRPDRTVVSEGEKIAGARIIPLFTKQENVDKAEAIAKEEAPVFWIEPFQPLKTGVIITGSEVYYGRIQDKFEPIMREKLAEFGADILGFTKCPDDLGMVEKAIKDFYDLGAQVILLTGGMSVDPDDITPTAIRNSGAEVLTYGIPMQPGNMFMMAYLGQTAIMGIPGASMHRKIISADIYLPRIYAGEKITEEDLTDMGVGGLCLMCKECHYPICYFGRR